MTANKGGVVTRTANPKYRRNGSIVVHHGYWFYSVKLPGAEKRRMLALRAPGAKHGLAADRPREMAEQAAARLWEDATREMRANHGERPLTVEELCAAYCAWSPSYYKHADGTPTSEVATIRISLREFRSMFGNAAVAELTHADMLVHRDALVRSGIARTTVNARVGVVKRMISWALEEALITPAIKVELTQVVNLKRGRSAARETAPVREVDDATIEKTVAAMMPNTADMVMVHRLTGMRPEEICALNWKCIDTSRTPWVYRPGTMDANKNGWRGEIGMPRAVLIGPRARAILNRHRESRSFPFSPQQATLEYLAVKAANAARHHTESRADPHAVRKPGPRWHTNEYRRTIAAACARAGIPSWGPNRMRHTFATEVRRHFGLDACRAVLGHSRGASVTDRYSFDAIEEETIRAASAAVEALG